MTLKRRALNAACAQTALAARALDRLVVRLSAAAGRATLEPGIDWPGLSWRRLRGWHRGTQCLAACSSGHRGGRWCLQ